MYFLIKPDLNPFFGGTYFPPSSSFGRPGFRELLEHLARAWKDEHERVLASSENVLGQLRALAEPGQAAAAPDPSLLESAFLQLRRTFDERWGGFGSAPKFQRPANFNFLARYYARASNGEAIEMVAKTLAAMSAGGIHDHLGGGFHRYSVDERWFVPHFEKMLYDQAQLLVACAEAHRITGDERLAKTARGIASYLLRDMTDAEGCFYSAEDADSPDPDDPSHAGEGSFYTWKKSEIARLLGRDSDLFCARYGVEDQGNVEQDPHGEFSGRNILYEAMSEDEAARGAGIAPGQENSALERARNTLLEARAKRPRPHLDRKILTSWNGLAISALARASLLLDEKKYLEAAERAAAFLLDRMYDAGSGDLLRRFCDGEAAIPGFLDDYALLATALLDLFEAAFEPRYLQIACALARRTLDLFEDRESGGFFSSRKDSMGLVLRVKDDYDGAEPSGNSAATDLLLRLARITGDDAFRAAADRSLRAFTPKIKAQPLIAPGMLVAIDRSFAEPEQVVVRCAEIGSEVERILRERRARFAPYSLTIAVTDDSAADLSRVAPFLGSLERKGRITIYECGNFTCELPKILD
ncbi:MAG: thioredoxin domain-containing protein [Bryobacteraceae bacterium]